MCKKEDCRPGQAEGASCSGIRFTSYNSKRILMMPEASKDQAQTDRGIRFAMLGGGVDDFSSSEKVIFTPGFHTRLQYFGSDPKIVMHLWTSSQDASKDFSSDSRTWACVDRPHESVIDPAIRRTVFNGTPPSSETAPAPLLGQKKARQKP